MVNRSGRCFYHPDRSGIGICVECRNVICTECTTQFEGINRCAKCLALKLANRDKANIRREWSFGSIVLAVISAAMLFGVVFGLASLVGR